MLQETKSQIGRESPRSTRTKLRLLGAGDLDGRTRAMKFVTEFEKQMGLDMAVDLTEAQRALTRRAAVLNAVLTDADALWCAEGAIDVPTYVTATNSLRRLLITLGVSRVSRPAGVVELMQDD